MDERIRGDYSGKGRPVPEWSLTRRLPITGVVGPVIGEDRTTYRYNSTFMDVTDQSYLERQYLAFSLCMLLAISALYTWGLAMMIANTPPFGELPPSGWFAYFIIIFAILSLSLIHI